jgi:molybdopterin/thiamine biosynthesis adenylyltransferase
MADAGIPSPQPLGYTERLELLRIERSSGVVEGSLVVGTDEEGRFKLTFDLCTEPTAEPPAADVRDIERIHFVYGEDRRFGETAPTWVMCDRPDFPREVGHLCAGPPGCPAVPCLALGGMQPVYERAGIEALMVRLREFMRDAKTGTLMAEGWEPVPFPVDQPFRSGEIEPRFFQDHAHAHPGEGHALGVAINFEQEGAQHVILYPQVIPLEEIRSAIGQRNSAQEGMERGYRGVPWIFLWPSPDRVETDPIFQAWRDQGELREGLRRIGVLEPYENAVGSMLLKDVDFRVSRPPAGGKALVVILGVWRPSPIMSDFFGYSDHEEARRLELRAYMISQDLVGDILADEAPVEAVIGDYPPRPELLRWVSGVGKLPPLSLFGAGALGSAIFDDLVRAGADDLFVQDKDRLGGHNLARHTGRMEDVYRRKTGHAVRLVTKVVQGNSAKIATSEEDIVSTSIEELRARSDGRLVIDATADERVRLRMDDLREVSGSTIVRTEMFHEGRLGAAFVSLPGGPNFSDLVLSMVAAAATVPAVAAWLDYEAQHPLGPDPMLYGFGCTSQTVHLPNHVVRQQASVAMTTILDEHGQSGIALNPLDEVHRPLGWIWLPVDPFSVLVPPTEPDWTVRLSADVVRLLTKERATALPLETGGYLYGRWDPARRRITVLSATPLPPGSTATATTLDLGPAGETVEERRLLRKTRGRLYLCGTWHSHAQGSARMSGRDWTTMTAHQERDEEALRPTLMVIVAEGELQAHLKVP